MVLGAPCFGVQSYLNDNVYVSSNANLIYEENPQKFWKLLRNEISGTKGNCTQGALDKAEAQLLAKRKIQSVSANEWYTRIFAALCLSHTLNLIVAVYLAVQRTTQSTIPNSFWSRHTPRSILACAMTFALSISALLLSLKYIASIDGYYIGAYTVAGVGILSYFWFVDRSFLLRRFEHAPSTANNRMSKLKIQYLRSVSIVQKLLYYRKQYKIHFCIGGMYYGIKAAFAESLRFSFKASQSCGAAQMMILYFCFLRQRC